MTAGLCGYGVDAGVDAAEAGDECMLDWVAVSPGDAVLGVMTVVGMMVYRGCKNINVVVLSKIGKLLK